jgi:hypothetical protein
MLTTQLLRGESFDANHLVEKPTEKNAAAISPGSKEKIEALKNFTLSVLDKAEGVSEAIRAM